MTNRSISDEATLLFYSHFFQKKQNVLAFDLAEHAVAEIIRLHRALIPGLPVKIVLY